MDLERRELLAALSSGLVLGAGCLSRSTDDPPCETPPPSVDRALDGDSTGCANPANATVTFVESSSEGRTSVTATLEGLSNADGIALATTYDDEAYHLSQEGESVTLNGFDESGGVRAFVSSCNSSREVGSYRIGGDACPSG